MKEKFFFQLMVIGSAISVFSSLVLVSWGLIDIRLNDRPLGYFVAFAGIIIFNLGIRWPIKHIFHHEKLHRLVGDEK